MEESIIEHERRCTDVLCLFLFIIFFGGFIGIMTYGIIEGNFDNVFTVYNPDGIRCEETSFPYGYLPKANELKNVICVKNCPDSTTAIQECLNEAINCPFGTFIANYTSTRVAFLCIPNQQAFGISELSSASIFTSWAYDLSYGYLILIGAAVGAIILSLFFMLLMRCCAGPIIWFLVLIAIISSIGIGILFILQSQGISISSQVNNLIPSLTTRTYIIIGSCLIGGGVLMALICFCLCGRINIACKAVAMAAVYVFETCYIVIVPFIQAILLLVAFTGIVIGTAYLYSTGDKTLNKPDAFIIVDFDVKLIVLMSFMLFGGFWTLCWIHGCNHFILSSATCIWYFTHNQYSQLNQSRCCNSFSRLMRYHAGTVAICSLLNGIFFIFKILANIFSFQNTQGDGCIVSCCIKCMNVLLCFFNLFLRFLSEGTYAQVAIYGTSYCTSTLNAFQVLTEGALKIAITGGMSTFFGIIGVIGISSGIGAAAYFSCLYIHYFAKLLTDPVPVTVVSAIIAFFISCIFMAMVDISAGSIIQCYLIDHESSNMNDAKYCHRAIKPMLLVQNTEY